LDSETRFDLGFAYLAEALAEAGYGVMIPNLNGAFTETYGATPDNRNALADQRSGQIIDAHLTRLAQAQGGDDPGFGVVLAGRVDLARLAMVGHSMGGGAAALSALQRAAGDAIASGLGPIAALVLVSPTRSYPMGQRPDAYQLPDVPTVVMAGGCDRDIFDLSSLYYVEMARQQPRTTPALGLLLLGANHNYFNAAVAEDDYYRQPNNGPLCNPQRSRDRLSRVAQENFLAQYTQAFLQAVWSTPANDAALAELGMSPRRAVPAQILGQSVLTTLVEPTAQRYPVFNADADSWVNYRATDGLDVTRCPALTACQPSSYPPFPGQITLRWATPTERFTLPLDQANVSALASLELRLAPDPAWAVPQNQPALAVVLADRQGRAARVEVFPTVPALQQFEADAIHGATAPLYPSALRIPLGQFYGVDLTALDRVELVFDQAPKGKLHLASVEFVGRSPWGS
jgi:dienelactone hydrolase